MLILCLYVKRFELLSCMKCAIQTCYYYYYCYNTQYVLAPGVSCLFVMHPSRLGGVGRRPPFYSLTLYFTVKCWLSDQVLGFKKCQVTLGFKRVKVAFVTLRSTLCPCWRFVAALHRLFSPSKTDTDGFTFADTLNPRVLWQNVDIWWAEDEKRLGESG